MTPTIFRSWKLDITLPSPQKTNRKQANKEKGWENGKLERETTAWTGRDGKGEKGDKRGLWGRCNLKSGNRRLAVTAAQYQALQTNAMKANGRKQSDDPKCRQRRKEISQSHGAWMLNVCSGRLYKEMVLQELFVGVFWYFRIQTGHDIEHNAPDRLFMLDKK